MSSGKKINNYYTTRNKVKLIRGGKEYFTQLLLLINSAQYSIHLQIYIYIDDETGLMIGEAVMNAAKRNVQVYFIADGYASRRMSKSFIEQLQNSGIHFKYFEPFFKSKHFYFGRRLHRKVFVADGKYALVGGMNITNRYNDMPDTPAWLDFAICVQGEAAVQLFNICTDMWKSNKPPIIQLPNDIEDFLQEIPQTEYCSVRLRRNDWIKNKNEIWRSYFELFNHANKSVIIMCSYFLPGKELLKRLSKAAKRDVQIKIILAGPSDVMIAKYAERYLYSQLLKNNIEIYEYQPNVLHAKLAITDGHWVTLGSYNINNISALASIEVNLEVRNKVFAHKVQEQIEEIIERDCTRITSETYKLTSGFFERLRQKISYYFIKIVITLFRFHFKREIEER
jgi:cardiolipin synthase